MLALYKFIYLLTYLLSFRPVWFNLSCLLAGSWWCSYASYLVSCRQLKSIRRLLMKLCFGW